MVFRRKKHKNTAEESIDFHALVLEQLEHMCEEGQILDDAVVLEAQDIYIYADVISVEHNAVSYTHLELDNGKQQPACH